MKLERALTILGFSYDDISDTDFPLIKQRYHRLMAKHHPDLVNKASPEQQKFHIEKAQLLNEAYTTIKESFAAYSSGKYASSGVGDYPKTNSSGRKYTDHRKNPFHRKGHWKAPVNDYAYCERDIYIDGGEYKGHKLDRYKVATGKYFWDPDMEEFDMFLYSLNLASGKLLDRAERNVMTAAGENFDSAAAPFYDNYHSGIYAKDISSQRSHYQLTIFQLLSEVFIDPVYCLRKIARPASSTHEIYQFKAHITYISDIHASDGADLRKGQAYFSNKQELRDINRALGDLAKGSLLYPAFLQNNRLYVKTKAGTVLGYISFADDRLYLLLIPLLREKKGKIRMQISSIEASRHQPFPIIQLALSIYIKKESVINESTKNSPEKDSASDQKTCYQELLNNKLQKKLLEYTSYIKPL